MLRAVHTKHSLYFSPLCIFGQVARLFCEEYRNSSDVGMPSGNATPDRTLPKVPDIELFEVPLGMPSPGFKTIYRQTPTLCISRSLPTDDITDVSDPEKALSPTPLVIEDYRMIWYEMYGRFLSADKHASERAILDARTTERFHSIILPLITSPTGHRIIKTSFGGISGSSEPFPGRLVYRFWTAPRLLHRLSRKTAMVSAPTSGVTEQLQSENPGITSGDLSGSKTAAIIDQAASEVLKRFTALKDRTSYSRSALGPRDFVPLR
jgi:hypothetical protein